MLMEDNYQPEFIQTKSRIGRGLNERKMSKKANPTGGLQSNNQNTFTSSKGLDNFQQSSGGFGQSRLNNHAQNSNVNVYNLDNEESIYNIDKNTEKLTNEIKNIDLKLNNNNNNYSSTNGGYNSFNNVPSFNQSNGMGGYESNLGGTGRIRRNRDNSQKKDETPTNTIGRSLNATFGSNQAQNKLTSTQTLDHFEQKENELKQQLLEYEKRQQQQEKIQQIQENAKRNTRSKLNQKQNDADLLIKLSSPTFTKKKGTISENQKLNTKEDFDSDALGGYIPGSMSRKPEGRPSLNGTQNLRSTGSNFQQTKVTSVKNVDEEVAVATGFQDCPFEDSQQDTEELITCPEGCGRQFKEKALQKHMPVCKKFFAHKDQEKELKKRIEEQKQRERSVNKAQKAGDKKKGGVNLAELKKQMKQKAIQQGGPKDELVQE